MIAAAVARYADRLHAGVGEGHHVASPLGAWLVLALTASAARDADAEHLGDVLGLPVAQAAGAARALLDDPHPAMLAAAAVWSVPLGGDAARWLTALPAPVERGPVPGQADADAWARARTLGMVEEFPLDMAQGWDLVLATALATRVTWLRPFEIVDADGMRSPWRHRVATVLRSPGLGHRGEIVGHPDAGDVAVHHAHADGLTVTSVIAAPDVAPRRVLAAAHDVARGGVPRLSLFGLPLGDGPSWTVEERDGDDREERCTALLPAWSARSEHDLTIPGTGFDVATGVLFRLLGTGGPWDARQAAVARYDRRGFEAAAVTGLAVDVSARLPAPGRERHALLRFDRPHAVVATADGPGPWNGLPVFSAWVGEPEDARPSTSRLRGVSLT